MPRADGRIEPGQKLTTAISARAWNRAQQAADIVLGTNPGNAAEPIAGLSSPYTWVYGKNTSGTNASRWGVLTITGVEITPTANDADAATRQFGTMPVLTLGADTYTGQRCVAIEPIAAGKVGRVAIAGAVQVKAADIDKLDGATELWKDANWALVRLDEGQIRLGTIDATWFKGDDATVTQIKGDGTEISPTVTFTAKNWFSSVIVTTGTKKVACAKVGEWWLLIAAECA